MRSIARRLALPVLPALPMLLLLIPALGAAAGTATEVGLGTTAANETYNELRQSVALLAGGGYASVWTEGPVQNRDVRMQWVRPDGSLVFGPGGLTVANSPQDENTAVVAADPSGGAYVAFTRDVMIGSENAREVRVQLYGANGVPQWPADGVLAAPPNVFEFQSEIQLATDSDGSLFACLGVFHTFGADTWDVVCQHMSPDGRRLWTDQGLRASYRPGWKVLPKLVEDGHGGLLVFWRNQRHPLSDPQVQTMLMEGQHFANDGTRLWGRRGRILRTTNLAEASDYSYSFFGAVSDGAGGAVVTFNDWNGKWKPTYDVLAQRVSGDGHLLWGDGVTVAGGPLHQQHDAVIAAPDGGAFVTVWNPDQAQLWLYRLLPSGQVSWRQPVSSTDGGPRPNDFGAHGSVDGGRLRVAWTHQRQDGTLDIDVYLAVFDLAGHRLNGAAATPITTAPDAQFLRGFVFDPTRHQGFAVWEDRRKGNWDDLDTIGAIYVEAP